MRNIPRIFQSGTSFLCWVWVTYSDIRRIKLAFLLLRLYFRILSARLQVWNQFYLCTCVFIFHFQSIIIEPRHEITCLRVFDQVRLKPSGQPQKLARGLKFRIRKLEILYYLGSEQQRC